MKIKQGCPKHSNRQKEKQTVVCMHEYVHNRTGWNAYTAYLVIIVSSFLNTPDCLRLC